MTQNNGASAQSEEVTITQGVNETAMQLITKAELDVQISTAKAFPRSIKQFMDRAMSVATINEEVAASCNYALPREGKTIEGPSVRLAEIVCSSYGNIRSGARVIENDGKTITAQGICHDLETNNCVTVEVKRRITNKYGKTYSEDMQVVTGNAACAIAFRNAVFKVIPAALIDGIYEETKRVAKGTAETLPKRREKALNYLIGIGVTHDQICAVLNIKSVEDIDLDTLGKLRGMCSAIKNGETTVNEVFASKTAEATKAVPEVERLTKLMQNAKDFAALKKLHKEIDNFSGEEKEALQAAYLTRDEQLEAAKS